MSPLEILLSILYFNVVTFGNGPVMIPLLQQRFVNQTGVLSLDQLLYAFALARVTPGQANFYICSVGYFLGGLPGAILATAAIQVPGYLMLPLQHLFQRFHHILSVQHFIRGLVATSVGVILAATVTLGRQAITTPLEVFVFGLMFVFIYLLKWGAIISLTAATTIGLVLYFAF